jgi:hypothetical protein
LQSGIVEAFASIDVLHPNRDMSDHSTSPSANDTTSSHFAEIDTPICRLHKTAALHQYCGIPPELLDRADELLE